MTSTAEQTRSYQGPAILSFGFRPFFLGGAVWALVAVVLWLPLLTGHLALPSTFSPLQWHVHELLYGYVPAIVAGFLLTAVPNWTGRLPVVGSRLLSLFLVWLFGRLAVACSLFIGAAVAPAIDSTFLTYLGIVITREIIAGKNTRNLKILVAVLLLIVGNILFHVEAGLETGTAYGTRVGIATTVLLIMLIGGRIIPSFTRNWLVRLNPGRLPQSFSRVDIAIMLVSACALAFWIAAPDQLLTAAAAILAAIANIVRLARWAGHRTVAEPLVLVLHVAYGFVPIGFVLVALGILQPVLISSSGALHAWTIGAIGLMTLAVMTRATLGHTGRNLSARWPTRLIYLFAALAAMARIAAAFGLHTGAMLHLSVLAWVLAFGGFVLVYGPMLLHSRS